MQLSAVLIPAEEGGVVAVNPETGTTTQWWIGRRSACQPARGNGAISRGISAEAPRQAFADDFWSGFACRL